MITEERLAEIESWFKDSKSVGVSLSVAEELTTEIRRLNKIIAQELSENDELGSEFTYVNALRAENQKFRKALEFYADPDVWDNDGICYSEARCLDLKTDEGVVAREALWIKE